MQLVILLISPALNDIEYFPLSRGIITIYLHYFKKTVLVSTLTHNLIYFTIRKSCDIEDFLVSPRGAKMSAVMSAGAHISRWRLKSTYRNCHPGGCFCAFIL